MQEDLYKKFEGLPDEVRDWLGSEKVSKIIGEINNRLGFVAAKGKVIPETILRLVVQDIFPQNFIDVLERGLATNGYTAKIIAEELKQRIFNSINFPLLALGIDISLIKLEAPEVLKIKPRPGTMGVAPSAPESPATAKTQELRTNESAVKVIEKNIPPTVQAGVTPPKITEAPAPSMSAISLKISNKGSLDEGTPPVKPLNIESGTKKLSPTTSLTPQTIKLNPNMQPTLKAEGSTIKLQEEKPFILHQEADFKTMGIADSFHSNIEVKSHAEPTKQVAARIEMWPDVNLKKSTAPPPPTPASGVKPAEIIRPQVPVVAAKPAIIKNMSAEPVATAQPRLSQKPSPLGEQKIGNIRIIDELPKSKINKPAPPANHRSEEAKAEGNTIDLRL